MLQSLNVGSLALYTKFINSKIEFLFPTLQPLDSFKGPLDFHGHGLWYVCKAALVIVPLT